MRTTGNPPSTTLGTGIRTGGSPVLSGPRATTCRGGAWGGRRGGERCDYGGQRAHGRGDTGAHADDDSGDDMEGGQDHPMETDDWWGTPAHRWSEGARWQPCGHGKWSRSSWADQLEREHDGRGDDDEDDGQPAAARRRLEDRGSGHQGEGAPQAPQRTPHQGGAAAAQAGDGDQEEQKRLYSARLNTIISMAVDAGVNPLTKDGEDLQLLDPRQLDEWVAANLPSALLC